MARQTMTAPLVLLLVVAAGCVAAEETTAVEQRGAEPPAEAQPAQYDEATGGVSGVVVDSELRPVASAALAIPDTEFRAESAQDGSFSLSKVPPGQYVLLVSALGYESGSTLIEVQAGQVTEVRLRLEVMPVVEPRVDLYIFNGYITCTVGAFGVLSEECGQGLQTDVGTYGTNPNNKIDYKFNVTEVENFRDMILEMDWTPGSAAANQLTLYVAHGFKCTPSCGVVDGGKVYCDTDNHGPPVQRCQFDELGIKDPSDDLPWDMTVRAWGAPVEATEIPNIVLEQAFTMYRTDFFGEPMPPSYSAVPDA